MGEVKGRLRKSLSKWASSADMEARELQEDAVKAGCCPIADASDRQRVELQGSLRTVTLRPRGGVPALEAELYDGSGADHAGLAGPSPDRRHRARPADQGRSAGSACRTRCGSCSTRATSCGDRDRGPRSAAETVEQVVRAQLSKALGGRRGMLEAAVPTLAFTVLFVSTKDLRLAVGVSVAVAVVLLVVRLVQRSTVQFVLNSLVGIGIGAFFAWRSARGGGDANDQALAYFLPGMIYNGGYAVLMVLSILVRWPRRRLHGRQRRGRPDRVAPRPAGGPAVPQPDLDAGRCPAWSGVARAAADLPRRQGRRRRRPDGRRARGQQDRDGLAAADRRPGRDGLAAGPQPHPGRAGARVEPA